MARSDCQSSRRLISQLRKDQLVLKDKVAVAIKDAQVEIVQAFKVDAQAAENVVALQVEAADVPAEVAELASIAAEAAEVEVVAALTSSRASLDHSRSKIKYLVSLKTVKSGFRL
jgi:hypothetical protein